VIRQSFIFLNAAGKVGGGVMLLYPDPGFVPPPACNAYHPLCPARVTIEQSLIFMNKAWGQKEGEGGGGVFVDAGATGDSMKDGVLCALSDCEILGAFA
jgi:hypothetical protein